MEKLEHDIENYQHKIRLAEDNTSKYGIPTFLFLFSIPFLFLFIASFNMTDNQLIYSLLGFIAFGLFILMRAYGKVEKQKSQAEKEKDEFLDEFKRTLITEEFIKLYENTVERLKKEDQSHHLNRIMFEKSKEYFDKFIVDISKKEKKDWDYFYCLYKHFYFYKHLKDHASFKRLDEKKFEPICYDSY
jgi:hypothetical protein